jgi:glycosyltransferase involved in cell wall biosynthesis
VRCLLLTQYFYPEIGAPQVRLAALAEALEHQGHEVEVVTAFPHYQAGKIHPAYEGRFYCRESFRGMPLHRTWIYAASGTGGRRLIEYLSFSLTSLFGLARCKRPDIIFVESPPLFLGVSGYLYAAVRHIPLVFNVADLWPDAVQGLGVMTNGALFRLAELLERWIYSKAKVVNAITSGVLSALIDKKGLSKNKVLFLPNGVDTSLFTRREPDPELGLQLNPDNKCVVLYAGTHGIAHGMEVILDAAKSLQNENILFVLIGDGSQKLFLMQLAEQYGLKNIRFLNSVPLEQLPRYYSIATASIVTLKRAALSKGVRPAKMFASLASEVPIVFSGEGEGADMLRNADAGIITAPGDGAELAAAISLVCNDTDTRLRLAKNGRALASHFTWDQITNRWLDELTRKLASCPA